MTSTGGAAPGPLVMSPVAFLTMSGRFLAAAKKVQGEQDVVPEHYPAGHYLLGHSIELALKAYLLAEGYGERQLRRLGHDLDQCLEAADQHGLRGHVTLTGDEAAAIALLNELYETKQLEYSQPLPEGGRLVSVPAPSVLTAIGAKLNQALRTHCLEALHRLRGSA